jgi:hypothetical protein
VPLLKASLPLFPFRGSWLVFALLAVSAFADAKPNVLFISIDDLNDYISPLDNHPGIKRRTLIVWRSVQSHSPMRIVRCPLVIILAWP